MRRKDREITDYNRALKIVGACDVCRIGLMDGDKPYIVPLNFGFEDIDGRLFLYFHCAREGKKLDLIKKNFGRASFEMDTANRLIEGEKGCDYTYMYESIMGEGTIEILSDEDERMHGLTCLVEHYAKGKPLAMDGHIVKRTCVLRLSVTGWSCKKH